MAITNTRQDWSPGSKVKVGFMALTVTSIESTPGDGMPDVYHLTSQTGVAYSFTPHYGLIRD